MATTKSVNRAASYASPPWAQRWFLKRSRDNWKNKYMNLKAERKRLDNRVRDVSKSRDQWAGEARELAQRVAQLEAENTALLLQLAAVKKDGPHATPGPD